MKILVTGAAGFIGSNLSRYLVQRCNHNVLGLDKLTYAGNEASLKDLREDSRFKFEVGDICDSATLERLFAEFQPQAVMHLAAESHVDRSIDGPEDFIQTNVVGTLRLLLASKHYWANLPEQERIAFRFHHVSTDEVYGSLSPDAPAFSETTPYDPHSPYSASKAASDHLVRAWHDTYRLPIVITNCSNNYGPYQFPEKLVPVVILKCLRGEAIPIYGNGTNVRDWLYVEDHCIALEKVVTKGKVGETYNIGGNNEMQNIQLVRMLCKIMDELSPTTIPLGTSSHDSLISFVKDRPGHDARYAIDATKISNDLAWSPSENSSTGFRKTVEWYLSNKAWWNEILNGNYKLERQGLKV